MSSIELPPVVEIILNGSISSFDNFQDFKRYLKASGVVKELKDQAEWTYQNYEYVDTQKINDFSGFGITPSGSLNPLSPVGKCIHDKCAAENVSNFMRTSVLYSDVSYISDSLTSFFANSGKIDELMCKSVFSTIRSLKAMEALIRHGAIRLCRPYTHCCKGCYQKNLATVREIGRNITENILTAGANISLTKTGHSYNINIESPLLSLDSKHSMFLPVEPKDLKLVYNTAANKKIPKTANDYIIKKISERLVGDMMSVMLEMESSTYTNTTLVAGSRLESLYLSELSKEVIDFATIEQWEAARTINLPWVTNLSGIELLRLRDEAADALPKLRILLGQKLNNCTKDEVKNVVAELKAQALEVENEFNKLKLPKEYRYRAGMSALAASFVVYGLMAGATGSPAAAATSIAGLLATAAHLRGNERELDGKVTGLKAMPAFVLLKAKNILAERLGNIKGVYHRILADDSRSRKM